MRSSAGSRNSRRQGGGVTNFPGDGQFVMHRHGDTVYPEHFGQATSTCAQDRPFGRLRVNSGQTRAQRKTMIDLHDANRNFQPRKAAKHLETRRRTATIRGDDSMSRPHAGIPQCLTPAAGRSRVFSSPTPARDRRGSVSGAFRALFEPECWKRCFAAASFQGNICRIIRHGSEP